jgi:hypothetical protein
VQTICTKAGNLNPEHDAIPEGLDGRRTAHNPFGMTQLRSAIAAPESKKAVK